MKSRLSMLAISLLMIGLLGFGYSLTLNAYKNEDLYQTQYMQIQTESTPDGSTREATKKFHELRVEHLTSKYKIQDYGLTLSAVGIAILIFSLLGGLEISAFKKKRNILFLGISAPILTSLATYAALMIDFERGEFPWWADSLAIPIATEIPLFLVLLIWALSHALFLRGRYEPGRVILRRDVLKSNYWLCAVTALSLALLVADLYAGHFLMIIPGCLWMYYYLSLAAGRTKLGTA